MEPLTLSCATCLCDHRPWSPGTAQSGPAPGGGLSAPWPLPIVRKNPRTPRGNVKDRRPAPPLPRPAGANFQKTRRWRRPRPGTVGGGRGGGAGAPGPVAPPPLAAARAAHLPPAGRPYSGNAPQPGRGPRPAQLAPRRDSRSSDGQHGAPDPARYARSRAPRWCGTLGPPRAAPGAEPRVHAGVWLPEPDPRSRTPAGPCSPCLVLLALAVRPAPLFQPEVAKEQARGHRGFPRPEPPGGLRGAGVPGPRAHPAGAPTTRATSWRRSHARRAAPSSGVRSAGGSPAPSEPLLRSASPPS